AAREQVGDLARDEVDAGRAVPRQTDQQQSDTDTGQPQLATQLGPCPSHCRESLPTQRVRAPYRSTVSSFRPLLPMSSTSSPASIERITTTSSWPVPSTVNRRR